MSLLKISSPFKRNKTLFLSLWVILLSFVILPESVFANEPVVSEEDIDKVVKILNGFITGAAALMWMVTAFITMFLYPGWVNGTLFWLQDYLKEIWILISNVVYFIFAFILIAIAFMNIIGKWEWTWELKQAMPKFIIWVLIVPFSWFFIQFVLSVSAVLTVWILTLPHDSFSDKPLYNEALDDTELAWEEICKDVIISFNGEFPDGSSSLSDGSADDELDEHIKCAEDWKVTIKQILVGNEDGSSTGLENSIFGIISIYSYGILRIDDLDTITGTDLESIETIADLVFKIVFDILFIAVYLLLMIALLLALFARWVRLWIYAMLSPAFGLLYFFWKGSDWVWGDENKFSIKEFIALALVPVYVSAALAFGLVFILVASQGIKEQNPEEDKLSAWGFSLTILWAHWDGESEKSVIWKLIVEIFWVVILWIAVMAALRQSETTKQITSPIAEFWKSVWQLAAKAPTYAPIIPTGEWKERMSVAGLWRFGTTLKWAVEWSAVERGSTFANELAWNWGQNTWALTRWITWLKTSLDSWTAWNRELAEKLNTLLHSTEWNATELWNDPSFRREIQRLWQHDNIGVDVNVNDQNRFARDLDEIMRKLDGNWVDFNIGDVRTPDIQNWNQFENALRTWTVAWATPWNTDVATTARDVTITINNNEQTAWEYLNTIWWVSSFEEVSDLDTKLVDEWITDPGTISAIKAAYNEWVAAEAADNNQA